MRILNPPHYIPRPVYAVNTCLLFGLIMGICIFFHHPDSLDASQNLICLNSVNPSDAVVLSDSHNKVIYAKNQTQQYIPASTLKILTALASIHHLGLSFRFRTEFYTDNEQNLLIKGHGDPLLISEVWQEISFNLAKKIRAINYLIIDDTYFSTPIRIPGVGNSTNPYDAPLGALSANFNTIFFDRDKHGGIISAEAQTPMIPFAQNKIMVLEKKKGRYTFSHDPHDAASYAGELLVHFLREKGVKVKGKVVPGTMGPDHKLIYTYYSDYTLETILRKMMEFSNNFMANQICIAMGAQIYGPPGTLRKGVNVILEYAENELGLKNLQIVEGSGISRKNRISAREMLTVLRKFKPYRHILKQSGSALYKTGTLKGISTRVGYIDASPKKTYCFVLFLNSGNVNTEHLMNCIASALTE